MKKKKKYKLPEENVRYTFLFPDGQRRTYSYVGLKQNGRIMLYCLNGNVITCWSQQRFAWMRKSCLIRADKIEAKTLEQKKQEAKIEEQPFEKKVIFELRNLSLATTNTIISKLNVNPLKLADELERLYVDSATEYTQEYMNRVCSQMMQARDIYLNLEDK